MADENAPNAVEFHDRYCLRKLRAPAGRMQTTTGGLSRLFSNPAYSRCRPAFAAPNGGGESGPFMASSNIISQTLI
jgi:hypothetical protein